MVGGTRAFTQTDTHTSAQTLFRRSPRACSRKPTHHTNKHTCARRWGANILRTSRACLHAIDRAAASPRGSMKVFHSLLKLAIIIFLSCTRTRAHAYTPNTCTITVEPVLSGLICWQERIFRLSMVPSSIAVLTTLLVANPKTFMKL